ncbi:hypothetical protein OHU25_40300 [Streptomyces sp. NBC_00117]|uniref:hypothetical protein n=1 Tax=Streptomyces sp. NBC_00117 TaxID=2975657 RepID=UPI003251C2E0
MCRALGRKYDPASARAELAEWIAARGGWNSARPAFTGALRRTRLHSRRHALLRLLAEELPDGHGPEFLRTLRYEEELRPSALFMAQSQAAAAALSAQGSAGRDAADAAARGDEDLDDREIALTAAESLLLMRETGGEEALLEQVGLERRRRGGVRHHARRGARLRPTRTRRAWSGSAGSTWPLSAAGPPGWGAYARTPPAGTRAAAPGSARSTAESGAHHLI